jgi:DNA invertase Pin-like site-specific DNA recombinase
MKIISYVRVSTQRQGASGLGLEAQRAAVEAFARSGGHEIVDTVVEIESGKRCDRPQLARALAKCKLVSATLVVARLDRLARDLAFIACMMRDNVDFLALDAPYATRLTLGILAAVGEDEARRISERTRVALAAARQRGTKLGGSKSHMFSDIERAKGRAKVTVARKEAARERARAIMPIVAEVKAAGNSTLQSIADELNRRGVPTARGCAWQAVSVARIIGRVEP